MLRGLSGDAESVSDAAEAASATSEGGSEEGPEVDDEEVLEHAVVAPAINGRGSGGDACDEEEVLDQSVVPPPTLWRGKTSSRKPTSEWRV